MPHSPCFNVPVLGFPKWLFQPLQFQGSREGGPIASENGGSTTGINSDRGDGYSYRKLVPSTPKARRIHRMSTLGKEDEESTERDKKQNKIISGSAHLENKWLHIASYPSFFWAVCAALRRLQAIDVGGCWIAKWISNWTFCVQRRLHAVLPHTKTLAVFPSTNPRDRTRLWARVARVQAASGVKAQEYGLLPRWSPTPFPGLAVTDSTLPSPPSLRPLLHSSASPPATARSSSTIVPSIVIHSLLPPHPPKNRLSSRR